MLSLPFLLFMLVLLILALVVPSPFRRHVEPLSDPCFDAVPEPENESPTERLQRLSEELTAKAERSDAVRERHTRKLK